MKKIRIASSVLTGIALILEILPFGIILKRDSFYQESTFHSYFDTEIFSLGNIGPFFCAIFTSIVFCMMLLFLFVKPHRAYMLSLCILSFVTVVLSLTPTLFDQYSIFGLAITILLAISAEMEIMAYINRKK